MASSGSMNTLWGTIKAAIVLISTEDLCHYFLGKLPRVPTRRTQCAVPGAGGEDMPLTTVPRHRGYQGRPAHRHCPPAGSTQGEA